MEILFITDFFCDGCRYPDVMANLSRHCILTEEREINIYNGKIYYALDCYSTDKTYFPKVVYAEGVKLRRDIPLTSVLPGIRRIGYFGTDRFGAVDDFGYVKEINYFRQMSKYNDENVRRYYDTKTTWKSLGNNMYRFTSDKGSWDIKVNGYD